MCFVAEELNGVLHLMLGVRPAGEVCGRDWVVFYFGPEVRGKLVSPDIPQQATEQDEQA